MTLPSLTPAAVRVLGALMEKETTTPEYYPLSLNALVNACNQKNNREPVMNLDEDAVRSALHTLANARLAQQARDTARVAKYEHLIQEALNLTRAESAVLCVLLLRGAQTPGELRSRTERIFAFEETADVLAVLQRLMMHEPTLVRILPRQPGTKESRYTHLFTADQGEPETLPLAPDDASWFAPPPVIAAREESFDFQRPAVADAPSAVEAAAEPVDLAERVVQLEAEVAVLTRELLELRRMVEAMLRKTGSR
jgi:uncharacterized protein YceH (UPF0502 family)